MGIESWNIVSAGPSREHLRREHLIEGAPVVTINRAIDISERDLPVDFAAFADGPTGCWIPLNIERYWKPGIQLWVTLKPMPVTVRPPGHDKDVTVPGPPTAYAWDQALPISCGLRFIPYGMQEKWDKPKEHRAAFTLLCVLKRVAQFSPKRVRLLCADMAGSYIPGMTEEECLAHDMKRQDLNRWVHERLSLKAELKRMRKAGIATELITPTPESVVVTQDSDEDEA